jgi:cell division protein FtsI/penicillin-binding protein 2
MALRRGKVLKKRTEYTLVLFAVLFGLIALRAFYIQVIDARRYRDRAQDIRMRTRPIHASRGIIYDCKGRVLAINLPGYAVYAHPRKIKDKEEVAGRLASITGLNINYVEGILASDKKFAYLGHQLPAEVGDKIQKEGLPAVGVEREPRRYYACGTLAANILGFTNREGRGQEGIEQAADTYLVGTDGFTIAEVDSRGRIIPETRRRTQPEVNGRDVVLTIDSYLQHIAESALKKTCDTYKPAGATALVMDPKTGEILALASFPTFDPNNRKGIKPDQWRLRAIKDLYEPGSTLKLITVAAGLEEGIPPRQILGTCVASGVPIGNRKIHCSLHPPYMAGHGGVDMYQVIRYSCNIGAASIAMKLGSEKLYDYEKAFGLQDRPDIGLPGAAYYPLPAPENWAKMQLANIGFGQGVSVTALQMAGAYSVIANGGNLMKPRLIREVMGEDGKPLEPFKPVVVRRVVSEATARLVTEMLTGCVDEGTGKSAQVPGYSVAGKTGSAQKASTTGRGYAAGKFVASFMGFLPAKNPELVICVVVDEPKGSHWGATVAAPVFQEIGRQAMWYLKVPPDVPVEKDTPGSTQSAKKVRSRLGAGNAG